MRKLVILLALLALVVAVPAFAQDDTAHVRVAHFATDAGSVDVYINGELSDIQEFEFGQVSDWMSVPAGTYDFAVAPAGSSVEDAVLTAEGVEIAADTWTTFAAIGLAGDDTLAIQPIAEDYSPLGLGQFRLTIFHAIPAAPAVDVYAGEQLLVRGLTFPGQALAQVGIDTPEANDGTTIIGSLDEGVYDVRVTVLDDPSTVVLDLPDTEFNAGNNYLVAAVGLASEPDVVVVSTNVERATQGQTDGVTQTFEEVECAAGETVNVRVAHFAHLARTDETSGVDVYLNGEASGVTVDFGDVSDFVELESGNYEVALVPAGGALEDAELTVENFPVCPESGYATVAAIGFAENSSLTLQPIEEDFTPLGLNRSRVTVFHAIPSAPAVNVVVNGETLIERLAYPGSLPGLDIAANDGLAIRDVDSGTYPVQVVLTDDPDTVVLDLGEVEFNNGRNYFVAAIGIPGAPDFALAIVEVPGE